MTVKAVFSSITLVGALCLMYTLYANLATIAYYVEHNLI